MSLFWVSGTTTGNYSTCRFHRSVGRPWAADALAHRGGLHTHLGEPEVLKNKDRVTGIHVWESGMSLCLLVETLTWDGERMTRTLCNPMVLCSSEKWHCCTSYKHLGNGTSSGLLKRLQRNSWKVRGSGEFQVMLGQKGQ